MIKGKTIIELHDAKSGRLIQKTEDTNMVTNALSYFYKQGGLTNPSAMNNANIRDNPLHYLLGGIMCLDSPLEEDSNLIRVPSGVKMTANGAKGILNSGNPIELGSWNETESGWLQDGSYSFVYDWTTSQGNGTIACVCLSSYYGGYKGIGNRSLTNKQIDMGMNAYNSIVDYDFSNVDPADNYGIGLHNNVLTHVSRADNSFFRNDKWRVDKYFFSKGEVNVKYGRSINNNLIESKEVSYQFNLQNYASGSHAFYQNGKYAYLMFAYARTSGSYYTRFFQFNNDNPVKVFKYDLEADQIVQEWSLCPSTTGLSAFELGGGVYPTLLCNGKYAVFSKYIFDLSNLVNVVEIENFTGEDTGLCAVSDDIAESESQRVDLGSGIKYPTNYSNGGTYSAINYDHLLGFRGLSIFRDPRYIATINNLSSPVTKTADKTMKVTYIISFNGGQ